MVEEKKDNIVTYIIVGLAAGLLIAYIFMKKRSTSTLPLSTLEANNRLYPESEQLHRLKVDNHYLSIDADHLNLTTLEDRLSNIERQSTRIERHIENIKEWPLHQQAPIEQMLKQIPLQPQPITIQQTPPIQQAPNSSQYKNNETWEIIRDQRGFVKKLTVVRDAKVNQNEPK